MCSNLRTKGDSKFHDEISDRAKKPPVMLAPHHATLAHKHGTTCNNNRRSLNNERKTYFEWELRPEVPFVHERRNRYSTCSLKLFHHRHRCCCLLLQLCTKFRISPVSKKTLSQALSLSLSHTLTHTNSYSLTEKMIRSG